ILLVMSLNAVSLGFTGIVTLGSNPEVITAARVEMPNPEKLATETREELRQRADDQTKRAAWWAFGGILLSMIAAVGAAGAGAGHHLVLERVFDRETKATAIRT